MSYFNRFPNVDYNFDGQIIKINNITKRVVVDDLVYTTPGALTSYNIKNDETPRMIAHQLYGDDRLYWVVLLLNNIYDIYQDWPKSVFEMSTFLHNKYGDSVDSVHHYEDSSGMVVFEGSLPVDEIILVTNREYEFNINNEKSVILLLEPSFVGEFVSNFESEISGHG